MAAKPTKKKPEEKNKKGVKVQKLSKSVLKKLVGGNAAQNNGTAKKRQS